MQKIEKAATNISECIINKELEKNDAGQLLEAQIIDRLSDLLIKHFNVYPKVIATYGTAERLSGSKYRLTARDLIYLFFEVQNEFAITITAEDIREYPFNSIENICQIVTGKLQPD
ncbi:MAG: hypothetical protein LBV33_00740 [Lachnospiraceae bacterium]|jgi:acyl carrier protein|nr:hypothetical protein [Lachnospiraceae bacterium]